MGNEMTNIELDDRGRITIPKEERDRLGFSPGTKLRLRREGNKLVIEKDISKEEFIRELKGCIKVISEKKVTPETLKGVWEKVRP